MSVFGGVIKEVARPTLAIFDIRIWQTPPSPGIRATQARLRMARISARPAVHSGPNYAIRP
jgi:hypothetical protein